MIKTAHLVFSIILCFGLVAQIAKKPNLNEANTHLQEYSKYNEAHHDNIDHDPDQHAHKHKHSDDGEEHEHHHEHTKITQNDIKVITHGEIITTQVRFIKATNGFFEKNLISNPHPFEIFRPPKV